jgi:hypothetical protein
MSSSASRSPAHCAWYRYNVYGLGNIRAPNNAGHSLSNQCSEAHRGRQAADPARPEFYSIAEATLRLQCEFPVACPGYYHVRLSVLALPSLSVLTAVCLRHAQLLQNGDCLLIYDDGQSTVSIYLEPIQSLGAAIQRGAYKKELKQDKLGGTSLYAFDETRRLLAVYGKLQVSRSQPDIVTCLNSNPGSSLCLRRAIHHAARLGKQSQLGVVVRPIYIHLPHDVRRRRRRRTRVC